MKDWLVFLLIFFGGYGMASFALDIIKSVASAVG